MKCEGRKNSKGSAMIIAFLLMAVIAGTAFAIGRLFYLDTALGSLYENSTVAYYAAESGIEEGLLRYRFDRTAEVAATPTDYTNYDKVNRNNLVTGKVDAGLGRATNITGTAQSQQIYDLNEYFKTPFYGTDIATINVLDEKDLSNPSYESEYSVARDEAVKIDITDAFSGTGSGDVQFVTKLGSLASGMTDASSLIEAKITGSKGGVVTEYKKALVTKIPTGTPYPSSYFKMDLIPGSDRVYQVNNLVNAIAGSVTFDQLSTPKPRVTLFLKPVGFDIKIGLKPTADGNTLAAPYTTVKSTGYYGGVGRTLTARIDRQSGTVYDLFDFVAYGTRQN